MYTISKTFHFSASHQLTRLPENHPCSRLHGHNYMVDLQLQSPMLNRYGFVVDYGDMAAFKQYLDTYLDHRHLNDMLQTDPTAENIARHLHTVARTLWPDVFIIVQVSETPSTWARYEILGGEAS